MLQHFNSHMATLSLLRPLVIFNHLTPKIKINYTARKLFLYYLDLDIPDKKNKNSTTLIDWSLNDQSV